MSHIYLGIKAKIYIYKIGMNIFEGLNFIAGVNLNVYKGLPAEV